MFEGVDFAVDDLGQFAVDAEDRAVLDLVGHAVADHGDAHAVFRVDAHVLQDLQGQADFLSGGFGEDGLADAVGGFRFHEDLDFHVAARHVSGLMNDDAGIAASVFIGAFVRVLGAFAGAQPAGVDGQQFSHLVNPRHGHAALEPVIDVLRRDFAVGGKISRCEMALPKEDAESIT